MYTVKMEKDAFTLEILARIRAASEAILKIKPRRTGMSCSTSGSQPLLLILSPTTLLFPRAVGKIDMRKQIFSVTY